MKKLLELNKLSTFVRILFPMSDEGRVRKYGHFKFWQIV